VEFLFRRLAQVHGAGAGGDDQCIAAVLTAITDESPGSFVKEYAMHMVEYDFGFEALGVLLHALH